MTLTEWADRAETIFTLLAAIAAAFAVYEVYQSRQERKQDLCLIMMCTPRDITGHHPPKQEMHKPEDGLSCNHGKKLCS